MPSGSTDLICLPENALYLRIKEGEAIAPLSLQSPAIAKLSAQAVRLQSAIHIGSAPLKGADGRLYNTSILLGADGAIEDHYKKIHLFDVDVVGHKPIRESDVFAHGQTPSIFEIKGWRVGCSICYDLRFSELFAYYARAKVDLILIPSAFIVPTGQAHWDVLTRARAIETQAFVIAAAQGGTHHGVRGGERSTYGHSMIIDPWGIVIATLPDGVQDARILEAELSRERLQSVRQQIPMANHRRPIGP